MLLTTSKIKKTRRGFSNFRIELNRGEEEQRNQLAGLKEQLSFNFSFVCDSLQLPLSFNERFAKPQESQTNSERFPKAAGALLPWVSVSQRKGAVTVSSAEGQTEPKFFEFGFVFFFQ